MTIVVRRAVQADAEAVREVGHKVWPVAYAGIASPSFLTEGLAQWWSPEAVARGIARGITFVAEDGDAVVGMTGLGREGEHGVTWKLYILPEYQGRGMGFVRTEDGTGRDLGPDLSWMSLDLKPA